MVFPRLIWRFLKGKNIILVFLSSLLLLVESFDKTVDVNGLKLYGENSDQVHFKFQLSKRDNPKAGFKSNFSAIEFLPADVFWGYVHEFLNLIKLKTIKANTSCLAEMGSLANSDFGQKKNDSTFICSTWR